MAIIAASITITDTRITTLEVITADLVLRALIMVVIMVLPVVTMVLPDRTISAGATDLGRNTLAPAAAVPPNGVVHHRFLRSPAERVTDSEGWNEAVPLSRAAGR